MNKVIITTIFVIGLFLVGAGTMAAQTPTVAGEWEGSMNTPGGSRPLKLTFKVDGEKLTGTVKRADGELPLQGTVKGADIAFSYSIVYNEHDLVLSFTGKVNGDSMGGDFSMGGNADDQWSAKRVPPAKPKSD
ncbi:hypothetical protein BH10ACI2_BH10ACI2_22520 [soil metagenome]